MLQFLSTFRQRETGAQRAEGFVELQGPAGRCRAKSIMVTAADRGGPRQPSPALELELLFLSTSSSRACATRRTPVATHALEGSIRPKAQEMLLAVMCEGECEIDEGQLTEVLAIGSRLGGRAGGCKKKIKSPLWESNP